MSRERAKDVSLAVATGATLALAFPPLHLGFLAYWGLIPFFFLLRGKNFRSALKWGYITGLIFNFGTLYWIGVITLPGAIAAILYLPIYFSLYAGLHQQLERYLGRHFIYAVPFVWTGVEILKSMGELGFPWTSLAYTQTYYLPLIQYASITGVFGVSFWVVWINVLIFQIIHYHRNLKKSLILTGVVAILILVPYFYGRWVIPPEDYFEEKVKVALVQGNVDPRKKWSREFLEDNFRLYERLSIEAARDQPDLIIWPETATACYIRSEPEYLRRLYNLVDSLGIPLVTGSPDYEFYGPGQLYTYNALFFLKPGRRWIDRYFKMHLVPFGERVPFEETLGFLTDLLNKLEMGQGDFSPGKKVITFNLSVRSPQMARASDSSSSFKARGVTFAGIICFESIFSRLVREFVRKGARFLVVVTNDAWFGRTSAPYQHAQIAIFRAIENRIAIARCANTGVSMFIDPYGRILKKTKIFEEAVISASLPLRQEETFFLKYGNVFLYMIGAGNLVVFGLALIRRLRSCG